MTKRKTIIIEIAQDIADEMCQLAYDSKKLLNPFYEEIIKKGIVAHEKGCINATKMFFDYQQQKGLKSKIGKENSLRDDL